MGDFIQYISLVVIAGILAFRLIGFWICLLIWLFDFIWFDFWATDFPLVVGFGVGFWILVGVWFLHGFGLCLVLGFAWFCRWCFWVSLLSSLGLLFVFWVT